MSREVKEQAKLLKPGKESETYEMGTQTELIGSHTTKDMATQASESRLITKEDVDKEAAEETWESIKTLCEENWDREAYRIKVCRGNPTSLLGDTDAVVLFDPDEGVGEMNILKQRLIKEVIELGKIKKGGGSEATEKK